MTAHDNPAQDSSATTPWSASGGTAVSSGQTSAYALKALRGDKAGERSGAHPVLPDMAAPVAQPGASGAHAKPTTSSGAHAKPPAALVDRWAVARSADFTCDIDTRPAVEPKKRTDDSVVGSITGFFKRCTSWLNEGERKHEEPMRTRAGLKVVTDPTPADGSLISLQYDERKPATATHRNKAKERSVREQAQRLAAAPDEDPPTASGLTQRILEKQRQMAEVERQRAQEAKAEAAQVTILRRRSDG